MSYSKHVCVLSMLVCQQVSSFAQVPKYEIGINAGTFIYQGDLTPTTLGSFKTPAFVWGLQVSKAVRDNYSIRLDVNIGRLKGNDTLYSPDWRKERAFAFTASARELIASLVYTPLTDTRIIPYAFAGLGFSFLNIQRDYSRFNTAFFQIEKTTIEGLGADINHPLPKTIPILPVGIGIRYGFMNRLSLSMEGSYRIMSTDYLDGFSQAANSSQKDHYYKYSIGLIYSFGNADNRRYGCPVIRN